MSEQAIQGCLETNVLFAFTRVGQQYTKVHLVDHKEKEKVDKEVIVKNGNSVQLLIWLHLH